MDRAALYRDAIERRRAFHLPGFVSYAQAGFDGAYVCPIHLSSGALTGPVLLTKDWLDAPSANRHRAGLLETGFLPDMPFNKVLDAALTLVGMTRSDIYITPVFKLMPPVRSFPLPASALHASFNAVTRHELMDRPVIAAGQAAIAMMQAADLPHVATAHPSARGQAFATRARALAQSLHLSLHQTPETHRA
ncbi:MAG: uracil-DNA glycosylase family protein [Roseinatronobacter sp.]